MEPGKTMQQAIWISLGAVLGANLRYWVTDSIANQLGKSFPYGTFIINLTGSLLLGLFVAVAGKSAGLDPRWRAFIAVGFIGAYTTFSTYAVDSVDLAMKGHWLLGLTNLVGSAILGGLMAFAGLYLGKLI
jgi:fluoride exporter